MDTDQRLTALKRAYADIILNTAKEAAARIMVSERKAVRFEYELKKAKDDAMHMLLRLKQMMDCKVSEAAMVSCSQQKKIEELEAQLHEAEDIVKDLRDELRAVESKLEMFSRNKHVKHPVQVDNASEKLLNFNIDHTNRKISLFANGDLPSIISRNKEIELYRNGCTQRIRVCERTPPNEKLFPAQTNEVIEKEIVLDQVKEMDLVADSSCLTFSSSVKHTNETIVEENSDESKSIVKDLLLTCDNQSTSGAELMLMKQEKEEVGPGFTSSELKVSNTNNVESQPLTDRVIKYTFQRKRKRGALINGSDSSDLSEENETDHMGPAKVNLIGELTP
ncbi:uncharacterized protein [Rutidosis leptorrhynchoides]|uniref:uncharacterized protein n=1 Tax=Rutidosis leptorrhynchoides TaxID=125765 RepID=UPI003A994222